MLNAIKNALTKMTPALPAESSSPASTVDVVKAQVSKKQKELHRGKTEAQVARLTVDLDTAQRELAHAEQVLGERMNDGLDATGATDAMKQTGDRVRALQAALTVAKQKDDEAQRALTDATRQTAIAADDEVVAAFKGSALKMEEVLCGEVKRAADELAAALKAVKDRSGGDAGVASSLKDFLLWFPVYRDGACAELIPSGRTYSQVLDEQKKPLSAWADAVAYAMTYRRKGK